MTGPQQCRSTKRLLGELFRVPFRDYAPDKRRGALAIPLHYLFSFFRRFEDIASSPLVRHSVKRGEEEGGGRTSILDVVSPPIKKKKREGRKGEGEGISLGRKANARDSFWIQAM